MKKEFIEGVDYYLEEGKVVFTEKYHLDKGKCCGNSCRHCPYIKPPVKGTTELESKKK